MICPKCQYQAQHYDADVVPGVCPACGIAYEKWLRAHKQVPHQTQPAMRALEEAELAALNVAAEPAETLWQRIFYYVCFMPSDRHESAFWGHIVLYLSFFVWGWYFILHGISWPTLGASFLHKVNLPFHEYGHVMFSIFGTYSMFLGGSLFQILLPLFPLFYFMVWQRDNFAASLMLWWCGQNFLDVAPYIADAPTRAIPLTTGNDNSHDWWNLLMLSDALDSAASLATLCFLLGVAVLVLSNVWGGFLLYTEFKGRTVLLTVANDVTDNPSDDGL